MKRTESGEPDDGKLSRPVREGVWGKVPASSGQLAPFLLHYLNLLNFFASTTQGEELWQAFGDRIMLINPISNSDHLVGLNAIDPLSPFEASDPDRVALLANALVSHIRSQSGFEMAEANRMQNIMAAAIGLLAEGGQGRLTLAEMPFLFEPSYRYEGKKRISEAHNPFVRYLLSKATHQGTLSFWNSQWPTWTANARREWVQSTEGRIFQYLFDERLLMTVCTAKHAKLDLAEAVKRGYWVFVNLPYALLSDTVTTLLGNLIATRIFYACMQRPPGSTPYRLILDEARFFANGPLDVILETSRAYNLWLTLVVQSLDQMCRSRNGRLDEHLMHTAINNARYFSIFHNTSDNETLARLMFPVTGRVIAGYNWHVHAFEYLPVPAEINENERFFMDLGPRQVVLWDKLGFEGPRVWRTPEVIMDEPDHRWLRRFEARHLAQTGAKKRAILEEISERQERVRSMFASKDKPPRRTASRMRPGGRL